MGEEGNVYGKLFLLFVGIKEFLEKYGGNDEIDGFITNLGVIIDSGAYPNMVASVRKKYISILDNILNMLTTKVEV